MEPDSTPRRFLKGLATHFLSASAVFLLFFGWVLLTLHEFAWIPVTLVLLLWAAYRSSSDIWNDYKNLCNQEKEHRQKDLLRAQSEIRSAQDQTEEARKETEDARKETALFRQSLLERSAGFPTLLKALEEYDKTQDQTLVRFLRNKKHPSVRSAEVVKEETRRRREAEFKYRNGQAIIDYYESIAPFLIDLKGDIGDGEEEERYREYTEEEQLDPITKFLAKEEFRKLPSVERNQLALDRYWKRSNKPKWLIGRMYERYIGYLYEMQGYEVEYVGIFHGYEDLGRDLICRSGGNHVIIQCKYWSQFRTVYEKHIFQFFGTVFQYRDENPLLFKAAARFYTTTQLSDLARRFAKELGIELFENFRFDETYPSIKCNVSRIDGEKIYNLPFDQQYDKVKVERERGEFYCATVKEAEDKGFRRAFKYRGIKPES